MFCRICGVVALAVAIGLHSHAARAEDNPILDILFGKQDPRLTATGIGVGLAGDAASYGLTRKRGMPPTQIASPGFAYFVTSAGCVAIYPIVATLVVQRPLTPREAYTGIAGCVIPFVGGWIADQLLPHDAWMDGVPEARHPHPQHRLHVSTRPRGAYTVPAFTGAMPRASVRRSNS